MGYIYNNWNTSPFTGSFNTNTYWPQNTYYYPTPVTFTSYGETLILSSVPTVLKDHCTKCSHHFPELRPNQANGTLICLACQKGE